MGTTSVTFTPSLRRPQAAERPDYEQLEHAQALAEAGRAHEAVRRTFAHLLPGIVVPDLAVAPFTFVQGSSRVTVSLDGEELAIAVPVVTLPTDARAVAALRYVLTRCAGSGQTYQPRLRGPAGDTIVLEFRSALARLHPAKLLEALRQMPLLADTTDDWMIDQFGATPVERAPIAPLSDDERARAEAFWRTHWAEIEELLKESRRRRSMWFLNELTSFALHRVAFVLPLAGSLRAQLDEAAQVFNDADQPPDKREAALARCARDMKALAPDALARQLGHATYAISPLQDGTPAKLLEHLGPGQYMEAVGRLRAAGKMMDTALSLISTYTFLLSIAAWPARVRAALEDGLARASGKPWREAALLLWDHAQALATEMDSIEDAVAAADEGGPDPRDSYDALPAEGGAA